MLKIKIVFKCIAVIALAASFSVCGLLTGTDIAEVYATAVNNEPVIRMGEDISMTRDEFLIWSSRNQIGFTPVTFGSLAPVLFSDTQLIRLADGAPSHTDARSSMLLPDRRLTAGELSAWINEYNDLGGINAVELEFVRLLNLQRAEANLPPLAVSPALMMSARFKAQEMEDLNYGIWSANRAANPHYSPVYGKFSVIPKMFGFQGIRGENIGGASGRVHMGDTPPVPIAGRRHEGLLISGLDGYLTNSERILSGWNHSPGHRRNMMAPDIQTIGIGVVRTIVGDNAGNTAAGWIRVSYQIAAMFGE